MCPTITGRIETRSYILIGPALIALALWGITGNEGFLILVGLHLLVGVVLDAFFYPNIVKWQPPWLTFVLTAGEFVIVFVLALTLKVGLDWYTAVIWFWIAWWIAIWTKIVVFPIISLAWVENAGEFRQTGWSVPPQLEPVALVTGPAGEPGKLAREFSAVTTLPPELQNLPAPSGVRRRIDPQPKGA